MKRNILILMASLLLFTLVGWSTTAVSAAPDYVKLIVLPEGLNGVLPNHSSGASELSADGRYVAFCSYASNLVPNDTNGKPDAFVVDSYTGDVERVSVTSTGAEMAGGVLCEVTDISGDGRFVVFVSDPPSGSGPDGIFLRDRQTGTTTLISRRPDGTQMGGIDPAISADGQHIIFVASDDYLAPDGAPRGHHLYGYDVETQTISYIVSLGPWVYPIWNWETDISGDGRYVVFVTGADHLGDTNTNDIKNVYLHDRDTDEDGIFDEPLRGETHNELISISLSGTGGGDHSSLPSISADGRYVTFSSDAADLVPNDKNGFSDVFIMDRSTGVIEIVSLHPDGSQAKNFSFESSISADGRFVLFRSADTLTNDAVVAGGGGTYRQDRLTGVTKLVSIGPNGTVGTTHPRISDDARTIIFESTDYLYNLSSSIHYEYIFLGRPSTN
ncbi:MAG: PD40 domain-containing protein [Anaerolineae bacterium]|nr:PD40 domain-containing protein [Anaerolineae bacterium]